MSYKKSISLVLGLISIFLLNSCGGLPGADAKKYPPDPNTRVKKKLGGR
jgi:hypothetical protein